jgi:hypothetical protein
MTQPVDEYQFEVMVYSWPGIKHGLQYAKRETKNTAEIPLKKAA